MNSDHHFPAPRGARFGKDGWAEAPIAEASQLAKSRMRLDLKDPEGRLDYKYLYEQISSPCPH
jgi:hypothetical protein